MSFASGDWTAAAREWFAPATAFKTQGTQGTQGVSLCSLCPLCFNTTPETAHCGEEPARPKERSDAESLEPPSPRPQRHLHTVRRAVVGEMDHGVGAGLSVDDDLAPAA